jgi:dienelactone hydrolase
VGIWFVRVAVAQEAPVRSQVRIDTAAGEISAELFEPSGSRARAAIIVLHGAGGTLLDGPEMRRVARALAADGNAAYVLHYFERTGTIIAFDSTMQQHFGDWLGTVRAAIPAIQSARGDFSPIGIYGYSLGAFLGLQVASDNARVGAVVEQAGGVWNDRFDTIGRMPPVLMVHGLRDARVPFTKYAGPLIPILRRRAATLQTHLFPDEGHGFTADAMKIVRGEAKRFFRVHLRPR